MKNTFETRQIGNTQLQISTLSFGAASVGNLYHTVSNSDAQTTLSTAVSVGINLFDTAPRDGLGLSERRVGGALRELDLVTYVLSTKVGRILSADCSANVSELRYGFDTPMPFNAHYNYTYDGIIRSYEDSLQRLGLAKIDILLVHDIGAETHDDKAQYYFDQLASSGYKALDELRSASQIKAVGLGVNESLICEQTMDIGQFDCFLLAGRYSLLEQAPLNNLFPKCSEHGATIILGGPYNSGILATDVKGNNALLFNYDPAPKSIINKVSQIEKVCDEYQVSLAAALQFPLGHSIFSSVIPGLDSPKRVHDTVELFFEKIPTEFWLALKNKGLLDENAPLPA